MRVGVSLGGWSLWVGFVVSLVGGLCREEVIACLGGLVYVGLGWRCPWGAGLCGAEVSPCLTGLTGSSDRQTADLLCCGPHGVCLAGLPLRLATVRNRTGPVHLPAAVLSALLPAGHERAHGTHGRCLQEGRCVYPHQHSLPGTAAERHVGPSCSPHTLSPKYTSLFSCLCLSSKGTCELGLCSPVKGLGVWTSWQLAAGSHAVRTMRTGPAPCCDPRAVRRWLQSPGGRHLPTAVQRPPELGGRPGKEECPKAGTQESVQEAWPPPGAALMR